MESLKNWTPLIISIITSLSTSITTIFITKQLLLNRGMKKIRVALESRDLFDKYGDSFKDEFINPDLRESYFYVQTGIDTNEKTIQKYVDFKNKLRGNYKWSDIKAVKKHLNLDGAEIQINLSKGERTISNAVLILCLIIFVFIIIGLIYLNKYTGQATRAEILSLSFLLMIPFLLIYILMKSINSILIVERMEIQLRKVIHDNNKS